MLYRNIDAARAEIYIKHITALCGHNVEFFFAFRKNCEKRLLASSGPSVSME